MKIATVLYDALYDGRAIVHLVETTMQDMTNHNEVNLNRPSQIELFQQVAKPDCGISICFRSVVT